MIYKYSAINTYSLRNLQNSQIFFNDPLNFNDPFDTFQPINLSSFSSKKFADLYCTYANPEFEKEILIGILNKNISNRDFFSFCQKHIDYFIDFDVNNNKPFRSKQEFLSYLKEIDSSTDLIKQINILFSIIKERIQGSVEDTIRKIRQESFMKIGVSCFSKNKSNLLMWSHYADNHRGFCLGFDENIEPFSKYTEVTYDSKIPEVECDMLFGDNAGDIAIEKFLSYKSIDWSYEEELRIFHRDPNKLYYYPSNSLKAIYFGLRADETDVELVCSIVKARNPNVKFYAMQKMNTTFGIEPKDFTYSTPMEVQAAILRLIVVSFETCEFTQNQLYDLTTNGITRKQLGVHLEDLVSKNILSKKEDKYSINK